MSKDKSREEFEAWAKVAYPNASAPDNAWIIWQAARAVLAATEQQAGALPAGVSQRIAMLGRTLDHCSRHAEDPCSVMREVGSKLIALAQVKEPAPAAGHTPEPLSHTVRQWNDATWLLEFALWCKRRPDLRAAAREMLLDQIPAPQAQGAGSQPTGAVRMVEAARINDILHQQDVLQPLAWHMARGLCEKLVAPTDAGQMEQRG